MEHSFIDQYSALNSAVHKTDPRIKVISSAIFILFTVFTPPGANLTFFLYGALLFTLIIISKVPFGFVLKRSLVILPFALLIAFSGFLVFRNVFIKSYLSSLCLILLTSTTKFPDLLKALEALNVPKLFIMILSFMYRYIFVTIDELMRMKQAKDARTIKGAKFLDLKALANLAGNLFIKAYERGERIYLAMCARGFDGDIKTLKRFRLTYKDVLFFTIFIGSLCLIKFRNGL